MKTLRSGLRTGQAAVKLRTRIVTYWVDEKTGGSGKRRLLAQVAAVLVGTLLALTTAAVRAQDSWPRIAIPEGVTPFKMGEQVNANGLPLRMRGVVSAKSPAQVAALFRASLGQPLVENMLASKLVLGRSQGGFYITVQLEPAGTGTRGLIAISNLGAAVTQHGASTKAEQHALSRLPAGSKLVSQTGSVDGTKSANHQVFMNTHSAKLNAGHIKRMLGAEEFSFEREIPAPPHTGSAQTGNSRNGTTLLFRRPDGEAVAVIYHNEAGNTIIVLNTITYSGRIQ